MNNIEYLQGGKELLDLVEPLWEKLKEHHKVNSNYFTKYFSNFSFEARKAKFLTDSIVSIRIDLVKDTEQNLFIGYCISTINNEHIGEVDSLFLEAEYRKLGIGDELMKRVLNWMEDSQVKTKIIGVAEGNEAVIDFYKRFGFYKRRIVLEQVKE